MTDVSPAKSFPEGNIITTSVCLFLDLRRGENPGNQPQRRAFVVVLPPEKREASTQNY